MGGEPTTAAGGTPGPPAEGAGEIAASRVPAAVLAAAYRAVSEFLLHPRDRDPAALGKAWEGLAEAPEEIGAPLAAFRREEAGGSEQTYVETLELAPTCPLYLGAHLFKEPETCREAGMSDRNRYMVGLRNLYRHFGLEPPGSELPDYLPLMVDFLRLTLERGGTRDRSVRRHYLERFVLPGLPPVTRCLREHDSVYVLPLEALQAAAGRDRERMADAPVWTPPDAAAEASPRCGVRLDRGPLEGSR